MMAIKRISIFSISLMVLTLFSIACTTPTANGGEDQPEEPGEGFAIESTDSPEEEAVVKEATATPIMVEELAENERLLADGTIAFTDDDRSTALQRTTEDWETNWNLRIIATEELLSGGPPRDGIPSIDDPQFISQEEAAEWLAENEPVIAVEIEGVARAYPLQILTWHEIVNDTLDGEPILVTFCPLCNSAIVFERTLEGAAVEFGTSGLLRNSDLVMYDRRTESLWQQFTGEALVGDAVGTKLSFLPSSLISFADFRNAYPDGEILSRDTGLNRPYGRNPYAGYDLLAHPLSAGGNFSLFQGEIDGRLGPADRVVTVSINEELDIAYPLSILEAAGVINDQLGDTNLVLFHKPGTASALGAEAIADGADVGATGVFSPVVDGELLTFTKNGDDIQDEQTGSSWNIVGYAVDGPLKGTRLTTVIHGDHFWFSWAAFKPDTLIFQIN